MDAELSGGSDEDDDDDDEDEDGDEDDDEEAGPNDGLDDDDEDLVARTRTTKTLGRGNPSGRRAVGANQSDSESDF